MVSETVKKYAIGAGAAGLGAGGVYFANYLSGGNALLVFGVVLTEILTGAALIVYDIYSQRRQSS